MDRLTTDDIRALRALYREAAGQWLDDENAGLIIDKLPLRLLETGLIRRLFPEARVLFLRRHPCDVVLSNFIQLFEPNEAFIHTGTLEGTVGFYDRVMGLWSRLAAQVGDRLAYVRYEDLVADAEGELERLCEFLDIEPHPDMLDSEKRAAGRGRIRTNSYQQVAEAVYSRSAGRWTRYRKHLEPHLETLRPHAEGMGYSVDIDT